MPLSTCATKLIIFGAGKIAEVVHSFLETDAKISIAGFTCDEAFMTSQQFNDLPLVPFKRVEAIFPPTEFSMFVAIGYQDINGLRAERCHQAQAKGYRLASWISPGAHVPRSCTIGANSIVMEGASLQPHARLGDDVFVWNGAVVGHHATIGDHCWLSANCTVSSSVAVEPLCFLGVNAAIGQGITIGARSIIGAATVITRSSAPDGVYIVPDTQRYRLDSKRFMKITRMT